MLSFEQIKELIDLVCERQLRGLEIERSGFRLRIDGNVSTPPSAVSEGDLGKPAAAEGAMAVPVAGEAEAAAGWVEERSAEREAPDGAHLLKSPIVGTFYAAPSPDSDPYVGVGDRVKTGQVLCIVEAMKLMNEIESDVDGVILEIYPQNAQPVEFGEPLFAIQPE